MTIEFWSLADRPDLLAAAEDLTGALYPVYMQHDTVSNACWSLLYGEHLARYQTIATDEGVVIAYGNSVPFFWPEGQELPDDGWDAVLRDGTAGAEGERRANALSALSIVVAPSHRGSALADRMLEAMKAAARANGLEALVAPVRPTRKADYPLQSFEDYCSWQTPDGAPFDPWVRKHWRLGARILKAAPRSMVIPGTLAQWQDWAGLRFPVSGKYAFAGGLAPLDVDVEGDSAVYVEPNLWMQHQI